VAAPSHAPHTSSSGMPPRDRKSKATLAALLLGAAAGCSTDPLTPCRRMRLSLASSCTKATHTTAVANRFCTLRLRLAGPRPGWIAPGMSTPVQ